MIGSRQWKCPISNVPRLCCLTIHKYILWGCLFECRKCIDFISLTMEFHNYHYISKSTYTTERLAKAACDWAQLPQGCMALFIIQSWSFNRFWWYMFPLFAGVALELAFLARIERRQKNLRKCESLFMSKQDLISWKQLFVLVQH